MYGGVNCVFKAKVTRLKSQNNSLTRSYLPDGGVCELGVGRGCGGGRVESVLRRGEKSRKCKSYLWGNHVVILAHAALLFLGGNCFISVPGSIERNHMAARCFTQSINTYALRSNLCIFTRDALRPPSLVHGKKWATDVAQRRHRLCLLVSGGVCFCLGFPKAVWVSSLGAETRNNRTRRVVFL